MANVTTPKIWCPQVYSTGGREFVADPLMWKLNMSTPVGDVAPGTILQASAVTAGTLDANAATVDPSYICMEIFDANGRSLDFQYVSSTNLALAQYYVTVFPVGGVIFQFSESGDTPIPDTAAFYYINIVVGTYVGTGQNLINPYGKAQPNILLSSSTVNSSSSSKHWQLQGLSPIASNPAYSATSGSIRNWLAKAVTPGASL